MIKFIWRDKMSLRKNEYIERLVDKKIEEYLSVFGAVSIEGPKWCGKTWTSLNHANSVVYLDEEEIKEKARLSFDLILNNEKPELIDEWNLIPEIWDAIRRKCDETTAKRKNSSFWCWKNWKNKNAYYEFIRIR